MKSKGSKYIRILLPVLHIIASFFYERLILKIDTDTEVVAAIAKSYSFSDTAERVMGYGIAKLFACIMIWLIWKLIFYIFDEFKTSRTLWVFGALFVLGGGLFLGILWPDTFAASEDNFLTYSYAIRLWPEYWHSAFSSCIYCACLMVFPHPISISLLQWLAAVCTLCYIYTRIDKSEKIASKYKWLVFLLWLVPDTYKLLTDSYRTEQYSILCLFYLSVIIMDIVDGRKRNGRELVGLMLIAAFISVWRTEGIILGFLSFLLLVIFVYKLPAKKIVLFGLGFLVAFLVIRTPQKLGDEKYYGSDYTFINSFPVLNVILNYEGSNLSYEGVEDDIAAIDAVVPHKLIEVYRMDGYRRYNYANGRADINQSLAGDEVSKAYTKAYYNLVLHNIPTYLKTQTCMVMVSIGLLDEEYNVKAREGLDAGEDLAPWVYPAADKGRADYYGYDGVSQRNENPVRAALSEKILGMRNKVNNFLDRFYLRSLVLILSVLFEIYIFLRELIKTIKKKGGSIGFSLLSLTLLLQAAAIAMVMPAGMLAYFHAFFYGTFALDLIYILRMRSAGLNAAPKENIGETAL